MFTKDLEFLDYVYTIIQIDRSYTTLYVLRKRFCS